MGLTLSNRETNKHSFLLITPFLLRPPRPPPLPPSSRIIKAARTWGFNVYALSPSSHPVPTLPLNRQERNNLSFLLTLQPPPQLSRLHRHGFSLLMRFLQHRILSRLGSHIVSGLRSRVRKVVFCSAWVEHFVNTKQLPGQTCVSEMSVQCAAWRQIVACTSKQRLHSLALTRFWR